ncbi:Delta 11 desaturase [Operophtera brumata]|uniref:Delta 11 desaturase n=1 Tax=Operophtera brumata TaxID=104452 RepID=A0A0L7KJY5_OPEBR|nr:Delta 11 desaturase [Operophtera brumata]
MKDELDVTEAPELEIEAREKDYRQRYIPKHVILFLYVHLSGLYGLYLALTAARWETIGLTIVLNYASIVGITAGAHRLWSHRAYKAKLPLQILLAAMTSLAFQFSTITWVRDHRAHQKFSDTDADPHNSKKGLFFSHMGWLMMDKNPAIKRKAKGIDLSDVYNNPVLRFQHDNFIIVGGLACFVVPPLIPLLWGESLWVAWHMNLARYILSLHPIFLVNSAAHKWGNKPYDRSIAPSQNIGVSIANLGEGFHNYHHTFPFDYRAAELGNIFNPTTKFIDLFAWLGWAYDLKTASHDLVTNRAKRTGDGTLWNRECA